MNGCGGTAFHKLNGRVAILLVVVALTGVSDDAIVGGLKPPTVLVGGVLIDVVGHEFLGSVKWRQKHGALHAFLCVS